MSDSIANPPRYERGRPSLERMSERPPYHLYSPMRRGTIHPVTSWSLLWAAFSLLSWRRSSALFFFGTAVNFTTIYDLLDAKTEDQPAPRWPSKCMNGRYCSLARREMGVPTSVGSSGRPSRHRTLMLSGALKRLVSTMGQRRKRKISDLG